MPHLAGVLNPVVLRSATGVGAQDASRPHRRREDLRWEATQLYSNPMRVTRNTI
jgi:hypothetical protein